MRHYWQPLLKRWKVAFRISCIGHLLGRPPYRTSTSATLGSVRAARKSWISVVHRLGRKPEEQTTAGTPIQVRGSIRAIRRPMCRLASMV
jgi:hypothetical protein